MGSAAQAAKRTSGSDGWSGPRPAARRRSLKAQSQTREKAEMVRRWMEAKAKGRNGRRASTGRSAERRGTPGARRAVAKRAYAMAAAAAAETAARARSSDAMPMPPRRPRAVATGGRSGSSTQHRDDLMSNGRWINTIESVINRRIKERV
uniref:Uncharacterized protein n=1 Tax=Oryza meridionalis TaxID=40149 RepID=A0A0E0ECM2_9ORYZ